jgi:hypothetical protein
MDNLLVFAIAALGLGATIQYFLGVKKNRWLGKIMSTQAENIFNPKESEYINIGGAIGFNFAYKLRDPWKEAKGTFTLFPRHSLLYMPFSLLIGGSDRFYVNLFTEKKLAGEGHIIEKAHLSKAKIEGMAEMTKEQVEKAGKTFMIFWRNGELRDTLMRTLNAMPEPAALSHFCCFSDNKTFFIYLRPVKGQVSGNLKAFADACPQYFR